MKDTWKEQFAEIRRQTPPRISRYSSSYHRYLELLAWEGYGEEAQERARALAATDLPPRALCAVACAIILGGKPSQRGPVVAEVLTSVKDYWALLRVTQALMRRGNPPELRPVTLATLQAAHALKNPGLFIELIEPLVRVGKTDEADRLGAVIQARTSFVSVMGLGRLAMAYHTLGRLKESKALGQAILTELRQTESPNFRDNMRELSYLSGDIFDSESRQYIADAVSDAAKKEIYSTQPNAEIKHWGAVLLLNAGRPEEALKLVQRQSEYANAYRTNFLWIHGESLVKQKKARLLADVTKASLDLTKINLPTRTQETGERLFCRAQLADTLLLIGEVALARRVVEECLHVLRSSSFYSLSLPVGTLFILGEVATRVGFLWEVLALAQTIKDNDINNLKRGVLSALKDRAQLQEALYLSPPADSSWATFRSSCYARQGDWQRARETIETIETVHYWLLLQEHLCKTNASFRKEGPTGKQSKHEIISGFLHL
jgi:hypothetical protein